MNGNGGKITVGGKEIPITSWEIKPIHYSPDELGFLDAKDARLKQLTEMLGVPKSVMIDGKKYSQSPAVACFQALAFEDAAIRYLDELVKQFALRCPDCGGRHLTLEGQLFCCWMHH